MRGRDLRFWGSAVLVAAVLAVLSAAFLPYEALGRQTEAERLDAWLLTLWCAGALCVCFGMAGFLSYGTSIGVREVYEAGSVARALESRREIARQRAASGFRNFAGWLLAAGASLIGLYFVAYLWLR